MNEHLDPALHWGDFPEGGWKRREDGDRIDHLFTAKDQIHLISGFAKANGCRMAGRRNKFTAAWLIVSVILSLTACEVACASSADDGCVTNTVQHHCLGQCVCHGVTVPATAATQSPLLIDGGKFGLAAIVDNSRLVPASIFNPPRA